MKRTYSPERKAEALAACAEWGQYRASKELGIPQRTIGRWAQAAGIVSRRDEKLKAAHEAYEANIAVKRAELKQLLIDKAVDLAHRMDEEHIDFKSAGPAGPMEVTYPKATAQACQQYATAIGILIDKFRLESGEVTSRDEHRNINESELDREIASLVEEHERRAQAGDSQPSSGDEVGLETVREAEAATA